MAACSPQVNDADIVQQSEVQEAVTNNEIEEVQADEDTPADEENLDNSEETQADAEVETQEEINESQAPQQNQTTDLGTPDTTNHKLIKVDGGDTNGYRQANVVVNIGFGNREYWAYTNEHGQLVRVTAKEIILQDESREKVNSNGRYYSRMADVPGVGADYGYDRGHVIADSLGGVANAYNITPQEATLNRHGDQAYMERNIRQAGGATDFEAIITYPDTKTQVPSHYKYTYTIKGHTVTDSFENTNPDKVNSDLGLTGESKQEQTKPAQNSSANSSDLNAQNPGNIEVGNVEAVDTNSNGTVTIQEAKDAGFSMPIYEGHWLYEHMIDGNNNGMVGE